MDDVQISIAICDIIPEYRFLEAEFWISNRQSKRTRDITSIYSQLVLVQNFAFMLVSSMEMSYQKRAYPDVFDLINVQSSKAMQRWERHKTPCLLIDCYDFE